MAELARIGDGDAPFQKRVGARYVPVRRLGEGGMGAVFEALDAVTQELVALKLPHGRRLAANGDAAMRFEREARLACRVRHPHVVPVLHAGVDSEVGPYYAMPRVDGVTLAAYLHQSGLLPFPAVAALASQLCEALDAIHRAGVVHRDIKPSNILLTWQGTQTFALVTDFGLAKSLAPRSPRSFVTDPRTILGSPFAMAPEQITGLTPADARTDLWALGVCLYLCASGRLPFSAELADQWLAIVRLPPRPLIGAGVTIPRWFESLVLRCLEKNPDKRLESAAAFARELRLFGAPTSLALPPAPVDHEGTAAGAETWARRTMTTATR